uniref:Copia-type retrotransposon polyprotein n=1 Tax=Sinapis alba TaxID=3728 RepID=A0A076KX75_SINAL|nr:copia-type retrotransposon polyprotein [Sinapis alba]
MSVESSEVKNTPEKSTRDVSSLPSPYILYGSDNPGAMITPVMLNGENYNQWANEMLNALQAKRKVCFINETLKKPATDDPDYDNWVAVNSMIIGWIRASIDPKIKASVTFVSEASLLWTDLKQRFSVGNKVRIHQIKAQLAACRQEGQSVLEYYGKVVHSLGRTRRLSTSANVYVVGAAKDIRKERDDDKVHQFIMGLDDSRFGSLCTSLIGMDPLPSIGEVYSKVVQEEQRLSTFTKQRTAARDFTPDQWKVLTQLIQEKSGSDKLSGPFLEDSDWNRLHTATCLWVRLAILIESQEAKTSLVREVAFVCLLDILLGKRDNKVYDMERGEFITSRDVVFREDGVSICYKICTGYHNNPGGSKRWMRTGSFTVPPVLVDLIDRGSLAGVTPTTDSPVNTASGSENLSPLADESDDIDEEVTTGAADLTDDTSGSETVNEALGRGRRHAVPSVKLKDYVTYNAEAHALSTHHAHTISVPQSSSSVQGNTLYPLTKFVCDSNFSPQQQAFLAAITAGVEPKHFKEAVGIDVWDNSMVDEIVALEGQHTWDICDLPLNKTALGSQWVYKIKYNTDGTIRRHKSRVVVMGNKQVEGEDYNETFAPVVKMTTVRMFLRLVAANQWEVFQMDVNNAFLHGDLDEEVYMKLPPGFRHSHPNKVCRLRKSLYGLKQAPRCWFKKLSDALLKFGFCQSYDDYSLFSYTRKGIQLHVLIYVDDLLISGNDRHMVQRFKDYLGKCFSMKDLGKLKYFLGIEVSRGPEGIFLSQRNICRLRKKLTGMQLNELCGFLKGSPGQGIMLSSSTDLSLTIYCDSDWSSCPSTRRSLSAFVAMLGDSPISWKTKKQDTVSHSSAEAEYRAMSDALKEVKWLRKLLHGFDIKQVSTRFFCDSKAAIYIATNPVFHERTKHVENDCHAVRDAVRDGLIILHHIRTNEQIADILTKALGRAQFTTLLSKLGVCDLHAPT